MRYKVWSARELDDLAGGTPFEGGEGIVKVFAGGGEGIHKIFAGGGEGVDKTPGVGHDLRISAAVETDHAESPQYRFRYAGGAE